MAGKQAGKGGGARKYGRNRHKAERYRNLEKRAQAKKRNISRDAKRTKLMDCGHGTRHLSNVDNTCKKCYGEKQIT